MKGFILLCSTHMYHTAIVGDIERQTAFVGTRHYTTQFSKQVVSANCPTYLTRYSKSKFPIGCQKVSTNLFGIRTPLGSSCCYRGSITIMVWWSSIRSTQPARHWGTFLGEIFHVISHGWFKYCLEATLTMTPMDEISNHCKETDKGFTCCHAVADVSDGCNFPWSHLNDKS
jgi:hypothetical protein